MNYLIASILFLTVILTVLGALLSVEITLLRRARERDSAQLNKKVPRLRVEEGGTLIFRRKIPPTMQHKSFSEQANSMLAEAVPHCIGDIPPGAEGGKKVSEGGSELFWNAAERRYWFSEKEGENE